MLKKILFIPLLLTVCPTVYSQDLKLTCDSTEIACFSGNKNHFDMVLYCPYEETDTVHLPQLIRDNAKNYLIERVGIEFYNRLNYYSSQIVDFRRYKEIKQQKGWVNKTSDKRVKYAIQYYFVVQDGMRYYISVVFDKEGNVISKHQLPNHADNAQFDKLLSVCDAQLIAEQDTVFPGKSLNVSLQYADSENTFVWRVGKPPVAGAKPRQTINRFVIINAVNGRIMSRETEGWTSVCGNTSF